MTTTQIASMIASIGVPYAYYQFPEGTEQPTPFVCFYYPDEPDFYADDSNYTNIKHLVIEVYTDNKDFELEATVEGALRASGMSWAKSETPIESERMFEVIYETDVVITEDNNNGE